MLATFKRIMSLTDSKTAWIQVACYLFGYGCFALPGALFIKKYGIFFQFFYRRESYIIFIYKSKTPIIAKKTSAGLSVTYLFTTFNFKKVLELAYQKAAVEARNMEIENARASNFYISEFSGEDYRLEPTSPSGKPPSQTAGQMGAPASESDYCFFHYEWLGNKAEYLGIQYSDIGEEKNKENHTYYWSPEARKLKEEVSFWKENADWFNQRGIVHRRAALLHGPPGSGKTQMTLQVAKELGLPIKKINLSNMSDKEFENVYNRGPEKCVIILLEDIDRIFNQSVNVLAETSKVKNLVSFDTLLNTIGGIKRNDGIFLVVTVNDLSRCSPALIRPGRCDVKIEVGSLDEGGRKFIAQNILKDWPIEIDKAVREGEGEVAAAFEHRCIERALELFYNRNEQT